MLSLFLALLVESPHMQPAADKHAATIEESVRLRTFVREWRGTTIAVSPDGKSVAYALVEPSVKKNFDETVLYVRKLAMDDGKSSSRSNGTALLRTRGITRLQWQSDGRHLLVLHRPGGDTGSVVRVDARSAAASPAHSDELNVEDFAASGDGQRVVLLVKLPDERQVDRFASRQGVVITDDDSFSAIDMRDSKQRAPALDAVLVTDAAGGSVTVFAGKRNVRLGWPDMSPDGRYATFYAFGEALPYPGHWERDPGFLQFRKSIAAFPPSELILAELPGAIASTARYEHTQTPLPLRFAVDVGGISNPTMLRWSNDSASFLVRTPSPAGGGNSLTEKPGVFQRPEHLFSIDAKTGAARAVMIDPPKQIPAFDENGTRVVALLAGGEFLILRRSSDPNGRWREEQRTKLPRGDVTRVLRVNDAGSAWLGVRENPSTPPDLWLWDAKRGTQTLLTQINPELDRQVLGRVERFEWTGRYGTQNWGHLIYPVGYLEGTRYPCVIMSKTWDDSFIHGAQMFRGNYPPQALASAGFIVLLRTNIPLGGADPTGELQRLPGGLREAAREMDGFESARRVLSERGLIDAQRVGIMGFSRSSWQVDYTLTHSEVSWGAAVSVDSGIYNYGTFLLDKNGRRTMGAMYGGPPSGDTLKVWLEHAPGFLPHRVNTPLLIQYHGTLLWAAEFYTGLRDLNKPVELIFFPQGQHILELPSERLASMQQVHDWFRFWLQGYERPTVEENPGRYARWRKLRDAAGGSTHQSLADDRD